MCQICQKKDCQKKDCCIDVEKLKAESIKAKNICSDKLKVKTNIYTDILNANNIFLDGQDLACLLKNGLSSFNQPLNYDCMECDGVPIKPDDINQDVWDLLECNRKAYQKEIQRQNTLGREDIRCIKQAYGCGADCPADCIPPPTCAPIFMASINLTTLNVISLEPNTGSILINSQIYTYNENDFQVAYGTYILEQVSGTHGGVGVYTVNISQNVPEVKMQGAFACPTVSEGATGPCPLVPPECIADWNTCSLEISNRLFKTITIPFISLNQSCPQLSEENKRIFVNSMNYSLNVNNISCELATRNVTVLVHFAYIDENNIPPIPNVNPCSECPDDIVIPPPSCISEQGGNECSNLSSKVICGIIDIQIKQIYYTINIVYGENFANNVNIPTFLIDAMYEATKPVDYKNVKGAFQLAIFLEEGLSISNNTTNRICPPPNGCNKNDPVSAGKTPCVIL